MPIGFDRTKVPGDSTKKEANVKPKTKKVAKSEDVAEDTKGSSQDTEFEDDDDFNVRKPDKNKKLLYVAIGVVILIVVALLYSMTSGNNSPKVTDVSATEDGSSSYTGSGNDEEDPYIYDENGKPIYSAETNQVVDGDSIDPGEADYSNSSQNTTTSKVFNTDDMIKDINGVDISATYNVTSRDYVYDYVSYVAKRGIIDDGMEIYWLEATYAGKKYRIQVPFYYFKDFNEQGVCRVQIEVLNIEGGGKVISYMQVVDNPSEQDMQE